MESHDCAWGIKFLENMMLDCENVSRIMMHAYAPLAGIKDVTGSGVLYTYHICSNSKKAMKK